MKRLSLLLILLSSLVVTGHVDLVPGTAPEHTVIDCSVTPVFEDCEGLPSIFGEVPAPQANLNSKAPEASKFLLFQKLFNGKNGFWSTETCFDFTTVRSFISIRESYISPQIYLGIAAFLL